MSKDWPEETDGNKRHDEWMERKERDKREREKKSVYMTLDMTRPSLSTKTQYQMWPVRNFLQRIVGLDHT